MNKTYFGNSAIAMIAILLLVIGVFAVFPFLLLLDPQQKVLFTLNIFSNISGVAISVFITLYFLDKYYTYEKQQNRNDTIVFLDKKINDFFITYCSNISNVFDIDFMNDIEFKNLSKEAAHYLHCIETHMSLIDQFENRYDCLKEILTKTEKDLLKDFELNNTSLDEISRIKHKLNYFDFENLLYICGNITKYLLTLPSDAKIKGSISYFEEIEKNLHILKQNVLNNQNELLILKHFRALSVSMINFCKKLSANEYELN
ncbi:MAG: hypothetical protein A2039_06090 [Candidatus Melainabacteria bacterium GWA2_34_9]|nr:MAG: hypothetical protein A2039_06090 [Candidatus Melainabacteria bacterium GWA2_34_9]